MIHLAPKLELPDSAVTQKFAFIGRSGSGKTYAAGKLAEGIFDAGGQLVVLDPVGVWWGLRLAANGKGKGLPIPVFGGLHEDIPLLPGGGAAVADAVVDARLSVVLDVSMMRKGERVRFATDFAEQLFHRKKEKRSPMHLIVEEAQVFVPQRVRPEEARLLGAFEDLIKLGRNFGIGFSMVSQRPQAVNKDALNQTEVLVALQTTGPQERKALAEWIVEQGLDKSLVDALPGLDVGHAYVWSPQWLKVLGTYRIGKKRTFNASSTPEMGEEDVDLKLAPVDLKEIQERMAESVKEAEENNPVRLKARLRQAEEMVRLSTLELEKKETETKVEQVEVPVFTRDDRDLLVSLDATLSLLSKEVSDAHNTVLDLMGRNGIGRLPNERERAIVEAGSVDMIGQELSRHFGHPSNPDGHKSWRLTIPGDRRAEEPPKLRGVPPHQVEIIVDDPLCPPSLRKGERKLLEVLSKGYPVRRTIAQAATLADMTPSGGTFKTYLGTLKRHGLVKVEGKEMVITAAGLAVAGGPVRQSYDDLVHTWLQALRKGERELFAKLLDEKGLTVSRENLARFCNMEVSGGTFKTYLGTLIRNGLAEKDGAGVRLGSMFN
jgi:hypothetical protein